MMYNHRKIIYLFFEILLIFAFNAGTSIIVYADTAFMMETVEMLSSKPRGYEDSTIADAREFIKDTFTELGLDVTLQKFSTDLIGVDGQPFIGVNIIGTRKPDVTPVGDVLIIGAHYDGANGFPAANDNGSGTAVLLELAHILSRVPTDTEIRFIAFDCEEAELLGSQYYANSITNEADNIIGMINFDMLASKNSDGVKVYSADEYENYLFNILKADEDFKDITLDVMYDQATSDYAPFKAKLIPTIDFSNDVILSEIHSEKDNIENIDPNMLEYAVRAGRVIAETIMSVDTLSYHSSAKHELSGKVYTISPNVRFPLFHDKDIFENALDIKLEPILSDGTMPRYFARAKLFNMDMPLDFIADINDASLINTDIASCHIEADINLFEELSSRMTELFGLPEHKMADNDAYIWNDTINGNQYYVMFDNDILRIDIHEYYDAAESYMVKDGTLSKIENSMPVGKIKVLKNDDKFISEVVPSQTLDDGSVTDNAVRVWEKLKTYLSANELNDIKYLSITSDGIGGGEPLNISYRVNEIQTTVNSIIEQMKDANLEQMEIQTAPFEMWITVDYMDILNENGVIYSDADLKRAIGIARCNCYERPSDWAYPNVIEAINTNILPYELQFGYKDNISRLDFCTIAYQILKDNINVSTPTVSFTDTDSPEIAALASVGIIYGKGENIFAPNDELTREEAAIILARIADYIEISRNIDVVSFYEDDSEISEWAKEDVYKITVLGIMNGVRDDKFEPQEECTKEQAIVTVMRLHDMIQSIK